MSCLFKVRLAFDGTGSCSSGSGAAAAVPAGAARSPAIMGGLSELQKALPYPCRREGARTLCGRLQRGADLRKIQTHTGISCLALQQIAEQTSGPRRRA